MDYNPDPLQQQADEADAKRQAEIAALQAADDLRWLMDHKQGRRIAWRFFGEAVRPTFDPNPTTHAFAEGRRTARAEMLSEVIEASPELYLQMLQENLK